jgi:hypothetical protein
VAGNKRKESDDPRPAPIKVPPVTFRSNDNNMHLDCTCNTNSTQSNYSLECSKSINLIKLLYDDK